MDVDKMKERGFLVFEGSELFRYRIMFATLVGQKIIISSNYLLINIIYRNKVRRYQSWTHW